MSFESDLESLGLESGKDKSRDVSFKPAPDDGGAGAQTSSLLQSMRGGAPEDMPASEGPRKISIQTVLTFGLLIVGAGVLYGMRQYAMNHGMQGTVSGNTDIKQYDVKPLSPEDERVLANLRKHATDEAVVGENISKNPFQLGEGATVAKGPKVDPNAAANALRREVQTALGGLTARSIMMGRVPLVKINDDIHKLGDVVAGVFEIVKIEDTGALLRVVNKGDPVDGEEHFLALQR